MKQLFDDISQEMSQLTTKRYSTSFSLGISFLDTELHKPIYSIYGFVRFADEIVDSFHGFDKEGLLADFKVQTYKAIAEGISLNPILNSFQWAVNKYAIPMELIDTFLNSMEMDLTDRDYDQATYKQYIYGSAEVVGLMCLRVFCAGDLAEYERLKSDACALGSAFQKINFLRDIKSDYEDRGRVYFPGIDYEQFTDLQKKEIEADIQADFDAGLRGIENLPAKAKKGVLLAYEYYIRLFEKIKQVPVARLKSERIRVPDWEKLLIYLRV